MILQAKSFETEISTCININKFRLIFTNSFINYYYLFYLFLFLFLSFKIQNSKNESFPLTLLLLNLHFHLLFYSRETAPLIEHCGDSDEMESPEKKTPPTPKKPPSQAEIDEFFSVTEKYEQKRFAEK